MSNCFNNICLTTSLVIGVILTALPTSAATVVYSDNTNWTAATSSPISIQFTGLAPTGSFTDYGTATGLTLSGATFLGYISAAAYDLAVVDSQFANQAFNFGGGASLRGPNNNRDTTSSFLPYIQVNLPANVTGIAADIMSATPSSLPFTVTLSNGETFSVATNAFPNTAFFGITADSPISFIDFALPTSGINGNTYGLLKDFQYSTSTVQQSGPNDTPEVATLIMIGTGLMLFRYMRKKSLGSAFTHA